MLRSLKLKVADLQASHDFYVQGMGFNMAAESRVNGRDQRQFALTNSDDVRLVLTETPFDKPAGFSERQHSYWKIGLCVDDVAEAAVQLNRAGIETTPPALFEDVGVLCHLRDPDGFTIELLQRSFELSKRSRAVSQSQASLKLGRAPLIGQVSLRVADINASLAFYQQHAKLGCISTQRVAAYGFTLYFLSHRNETPPELRSDPVAHREWLWRRRYTLLELQHYDDGRGFAQHPGFEELYIEVKKGSEGTLFDPDGHRIRFQT